MPERQERSILEFLTLGRGTTLVATLIVLLLVWAILMQWERARKLLAGRPIFGAMTEAVLIVCIAYALDAIFSLVSTLPRFAAWASFLDHTGQFILHVGSAVAIARILEGIWTKRRADRSSRRLAGLTWISYYGVFALAGVVTFVVAQGRAPTELFVWTGATAAVLAFVMQKTLGDLVSGLSLTIERPFDIGDWIRLEDGTEGQVEDVNWRATRLRKWDKTSFVVPNGRLAQECFTNLYGSRHVFSPWYTVKISNEYPPALVIALLEQAARGCETPMRDPAPLVRLLDASSTPYSYMVWVQFSNYPMMFAGRGELYMRIDEVLRDAGIEIAGEIHEVRYRSVEANATEASSAEAGRDTDLPRDETHDFG